jgi:uncharacterized protein (DUF2235 family)
MSEIGDQALVERPARGNEQGEGSKDGPPPPHRKYVLFADGTGNAFTTQESNVWRLYEALDRTKPDQVAYYIKGVGTAGWAPLAALDGATGIGVPSNVRKLYRFLCRNWQPGDQIYIFGFSRGAFTARTLAALIATQGLVPAEIDEVPVSHAEMQRNVMSAWREYRRETVPWHKSLPTIWLGRAIRDAILALYHRLLRHRSYEDVRGQMDDKRRNAGIAFLGLFDTVEAFGVPIEELRSAIDWAIWPVSFRNRVLSDKVARARHALSLDDERTSFHPIRIDHPDPEEVRKTDPARAERIKEVWFAGVHSDVGGGYPDGTLSYVPLVWMAQQVRDDLRFQPGSFEHFCAYQSAIGPIHDSRSGASVIYRYGPRPIGEDPKVDGGPPVVHLGVVERMLHGCDDYAPIMLPASSKVLMPDGRVMALTEENTRWAMKSAYEASPKAQAQDTHTAAAAEAFVEMSPPNDSIIQQALDTVWWRRFAYFSLLATLALLVAWPWVAVKVIGMLKGPTDRVAVNGVSALDVIRVLDYGTGAVIGPPASFLQGFLPSYVEPWLKIIILYPFATTLVLILLVTAWQMNSFLRDRVQERARLAWSRPNRSVPDIGKASSLLKIGRALRQHGRPWRIAFSNFALPGIFLIAIFGASLLVVSRSYFNWRGGIGNFCERTTSLTAVGEQPITAAALFDISNACWNSGLWVEKGRKYRVWIDVRDPWFDRTIMSGANGFRDYSWRHLSALPLRRSYAADWFQPVARIGERGDVEFPLDEVNVRPADDLPRRRNPADSDNDQTSSIGGDKAAEPANVEIGLKFGNFEPIPPAVLPAAREVWRKQGLADAMVADFIAPESGELFLYVNDAIQPLPLLAPFDLFYKNNSGTAQVTLQRAPPPPKPDK